MQMAGPDIVLFVVGALLFGGATYAIVEDGGLGTSTSALGAFEVSFQTAMTEVGSEQFPNMRSASAEFDVTQTNVTHVMVTVDCTDAASAAVPFTLQVQVEGPNGLAADPVSGQCGQAVVVEVPVTDAPGNTVVQGSTEPDARANLPPVEGQGAAVGTWTVTVSGARQGSPLPVGDPAGTITLEVEEWTPRFTPVQR